MRIACYVILLILGVFIFVAGVSIWFVIPVIVRKRVGDLLPLPKKTVVYEQWANTSLPIRMQFWFFSVSNKAEVENGSKPVLIEKGPYTYREYRIKQNVTFNSNGTVSYKQRRSFFFDRKESIGDESDVITTVNIPLVVIAEKVLNPGPFSKIIEFILKFYHDKDVFIDLSVGNLTWGYEDPLLKMISDVAKVIKVDFNPIVGLFYGKNDTDDGEYVIDSGAFSLDYFLAVKEWRGSANLSFWNDAGANMINGTDGTMFPPFLNTLPNASLLYVFQSDICRSIYAIHSSSSTIHGIPAHTYTPPYAVFANHSENPANWGFCVDGVCLGSGVLNLSTCISGMPVVMSQPQLYQAAEQYQQDIIGLLPSEDCVTSLSIEPTTGLPLDLQKKLQINIAMKPSAAFDNMHRLPKMLLPVMWLNESVKIDDDLASLIRSMLIIPVEAATGVSIALMALGPFLSILILLFLLVKFRKSINSGYKIINDNDIHT